MCIYEKKNFIYHKPIQQIISHTAKIYEGLQESQSHLSRPPIVSTQILTAVSKREKQHTHTNVEEKKS